MMLLQFGERRNPVFRSRLVSLLKFVIDLVLDETSLVDKILLVCHNFCVCFTFALRAYQVDLVNNRSWFFQTCRPIEMSHLLDALDFNLSWFFKIDFAQQLFQHGF